MGISNTATGTLYLSSVLVSSRIEKDVMAQGGNPRQVINVPVHIHITALSEVDQYYEAEITNITNISDSNIDAVIAEAPENSANLEQDSENDGLQVKADNVAEGAQQENVGSRSTAKKKTSLLKDLSNVVNKLSKGESSKSKDSFSTPGQILSPTAKDSDELSQIGVLRERIAAYMWRKKPDYIEAYQLLEKLSGLQPMCDFDIKLQQAECYVHMGREGKFTQTLANIAAKQISTDSLITLATDLLKSQAYTRALILLLVISETYHKDNLSPDELVNTVFEVGQQMHIAIKGMIEIGGKTKDIACDLGVKRIHEVYGHLLDVEKCNYAKRSVKQARFLDCMGSIYKAVGEMQESLSQRCIAVELLETQFGRSASNYYIYGRLLNNIGISHLKLGSLSKAKWYLIMTIESCKHAVDFKNENDRRKAIERAENDLKKCQIKSTQ